jgi:hypothetical protein
MQERSHAFFSDFLAFDDADFHQCLPANAISIEAVLGQIPDAFRDLESYGQWLSGWDSAGDRGRPEPGEGLEDALRVRLRVTEDLEPKWRVIKNDEDEGVSFKAPDRAKGASAVSLPLSFQRQIAHAPMGRAPHLAEGLRWRR